MILKMMTFSLMAMIGMCANADVIGNGSAYQRGVVHTVNAAPTIRTLGITATTLITIPKTTQNAIGANSVSKTEKEDGLIHQSTSTVLDDTLNIEAIIPNAFDEWDAEQKRKAGLVSGECPTDRSCHGDEERWLSHLPTLGELIDQYFEPEDREFFTWLAHCESSGKPEDIYSDAIHPKSKATGWFQHLPKFWIERSVRSGFIGFSIDHPVANVGVAAWLFYEDGGAKHWRACTKKYIREVFQQ